jgi:uncharacterized peroxidase-related enzyme
MKDYPISRYPVPAVDGLPEDMRARISSVQAKLGFIPNVFLTLAHRPEEFRAFFAYFDALMLKEGGLSKTEREMIVVATTALNHCIYCVAHHSAILRLRAKNAVVADQVAINYCRADLSQRERAMLDFAAKVATESHALRDEDFVALHEHGFTDEDIWDIGAITTFFAHGSRLANLIAMRPNPEFYVMGRSAG